MTQEIDRFVTQFGSSIEFVSGHIEIFERLAGVREKAELDHQHASINVADGHQNLDYAAADAVMGAGRVNEGLPGYSTRLLRVYQFLSLLRNTDVKASFGRCLDIGCGRAIQPRIMKGLGIIREAIAIDVFDRASMIDERVLVKKHRQFRRLRMLDSVQERIESKPVKTRSALQNVILNRLPNPRSGFKGTGWMPDVGVFKTHLRRKPHLDRYINGDVFELEDKFDLITSFSSLEWFEAHSIFRKIAELLEPNGVFYLWVPNWWSTDNPRKLPGHFPYASQRLTQEDYFRYLDEFFPESADAHKVAYRSFDPNHPTLSDYIRIGSENGLVLLDYKANVSPKPAQRNVGITPVGYSWLDPSVFKDVLEDIHQFRPDVRLEDLIPATHSIVFQKVRQVPSGDPLASEEWLSSTREVEIANPVARFVVRATRRLLAETLWRSWYKR
jgi:SAM-dependent methyltransferase